MEQAEEQKAKKLSKYQRFVNHVITEIAKNSGFRAALKRADNPTTAYQSWEYLAKWCAIDKKGQYLPYTTIGAALAKAKVEHEGTLGIGRALASCYDDGNKSDQAKRKLRRLLSCTNIAEVCEVVRPLLSLISSRSNGSLNYSRLLEELRYFNEQTRQKWAIDFYGKPVEPMEEEA